MFHGSLRKYKPVTRKGVKKYYFESLLTSSDIDLIKSSIISNQYLSDEELDFLSATVSTLSTDTFSEADGRNNPKAGGKDIYTFTVKAQYDNLVMFCAQQHMMVTAVSPEELINDVTAILEEAITRYKSSLSP